MKAITWNVNGVRSCAGKGLLEFFRREQPDLFCLQETRISPEDAARFPWPEGYHAYWHSGERKGYAGVALFSRQEPFRVDYGPGPDGPDTEGRLLTAEFPGFYLVTVYTPNSRRDLARLDYRTQVWDPHFARHLRRLDRKKPVLFCGDLNVARHEIDLANPKSNVRNAGFTPEERAAFEAVLGDAFIDAFREIEPEPGHYTWWSYRSKARERNVGWRIDYWCLSRRLLPAVRSVTILASVPGSDHCPVAIDFEPPAPKK
ncbi:MAG: exodeoxyribonuclease III [Puniceicoccaceae bacterium]|nr:MAG: exodeoxyribonuclease III [Puniceicoccaceae bacterium]